MYGAINVYNTSSISMISLVHLWADTHYQVCGYADNVYGNTSAGSVQYFDTTAQDSNYNWEISA